MLLKEVHDVKEGLLLIRMDLISWSIARMSCAEVDSRVSCVQWPRTVLHT